MKLYYAPGACSLAAHIILNEINVDFDLVRVDLKTHKTEKGADYYEINPKGYVPALEINPGLILTENVAILPFLAQHDPKQDLIPPSGLGRAKVLEWLGYLNSELHDAYAVFFGAPLDAAAKEKASPIGQMASNMIYHHIKILSLSVIKWLNVSQYKLQCEMKV